MVHNYFRSPSSRRMWRLAGRYSTVGIQIALCVAIGLFGGRYLDGHFQSEPLFFWIGLVVGSAAAIRSTWRTLKGVHLDRL